jgi:hypothetical protein
MFVDDAQIDLEEQNVNTAPTPAAGRIALVADSFTGHLWQIDDQGVALDLCYPVNLRYAHYQWDCNNLGTAANIQGWQCSTIALGTITNVTNSIASGTPTATQAINLQNHPGVLSFSSSTTANSGGQCTWGGTTTGSPVAAGRVYDFVFFTVNLANATIRLGTNDSFSVADSVDGVYIEVLPGGIASGKSSNNSVQTVSASSFTLAANTWYHARISIPTATTGLFQIFNEAGTLLWSDTVTGNIPTGVGRNSLPRFIVTNSTTTATLVCQLDMASWKGSVTRGALR